MKSKGLATLRDEDHLVSTLNALLVQIHIPIPVESPHDLSPLMLLAILESINGQRLPIPEKVRASRDFSAKVTAMKVFLGVLENDVIRMDVGLSNIDPRRLAKGEWEEVVFIGELLCWLGKAANLLPSTPEDVCAKPPVFRLRAISPSTHSTVTTGAHSNLSMMRSAPAGSDTTVMSAASDLPAPLPELDVFVSTSIQSLPPPPRRSPNPPPRPRPRCIHEIEDPSFMRDLDSSDVEDSQISYCTCSASASMRSAAPRTVRHSEYVEPDDDASETEFFEASRQEPRARSPTHSRTASNPTISRSPFPRLTSTPRRPAGRLGTPPATTRQNSPGYTLALMDERAQLLTELAALRASTRKR